MNSRTLVLILAVALAGGGALYWSLTKLPESTPAPAVPAQAQAKTASSMPAPAPIRPSLPEAANGQKSKPTPAVAAEEPLYEKQIDDVLRSNVGEAQSAKILIGMLPAMPEEGQVEAAQHIANLLPDSDYQSAMPILLNPNMPESVTSVLFTDLMNRGDSTKLNAFLQIAQVPNHPNKEESLSDLQIYLDNDYGTDWAKWGKAIKDYLAKQAAEQ
jgi:hypothetical protein